MWQICDGVRFVRDILPGLQRMARAIRMSTISVREFSAALTRFRGDA